MKATFFLFVNTTKINQFKAKDSKIKPYPLWLGNILKDFAVNNKLIIILLILGILSVFMNI